MALAGFLLSLLQEPAPAPRPPRARGWGDFPVFVWREKHAGQPLPKELVEPFGGVILMREEDSAWAREQGLSYLVWNVAGRNALHLDADEAWNARVEKWIKTRDEKLLVREPCLNDPKTTEQLFATYDATLKKHGEHPGLGFVLGDEVSLTPNGDPFDLCRCGFCEAKWQEYAEKNKLPERAPLTDEVRLDLLEEDYSSLGAWLARRRFHREETLHTLLRLREHALDPTDPRHSPRLGLLGNTGQTAFGGLDLSWSATLFEFVEFYPLLDARESFLAGNHRVGDHGRLPFVERQPVSNATLATIFVDQETPDSYAWRVWEHWLRGGRGLVLWSDQSLERRPEHLARLQQAVCDIRALHERGVFTQLAQDGGALVTDGDSIAAAFLRDALLDGPTWPRRRASYQAEHGTRERKVQSWLRWIEDRGRLPAVLNLRDVRGDCAGAFGFLVLPEILVADEEDLTHLEDFVRAGGTLYIDGPLGWVDRHGRRRQEGVIERLKKSAPERVLPPPEDLPSYLGRRGLSTSAPQRFRDRAQLDALLNQRSRSSPGHEALLPDLGEDFGRLPWLVARGGQSRGSFPADPVFVVLQNAATAAERGTLRDLPLVADPDDLTWIHPRDGKTLRAGDPAVFLPKRFRPPAPLK
jgi:hypothetical protein